MDAGSPIPGFGKLDACAGTIRDASVTRIADAVAQVSVTRSWGWSPTYTRLGTAMAESAALLQVRGVASTVKVA